MVERNGLDQPQLPFAMPLHSSTLEDTSQQWIGAEPGKMGLVFNV